MLTCPSPQRFTEIPIDLGAVFVSYGAPVWRTIMLRNLSVAAISALVIASYKHSAFGASIGVGNPYPVSNYTCQDGTRLAVRLLGDRASVSVNDAAEVDLLSMGSEGTTYSNGRWTLTIAEGRLSWALAEQRRPHAPAVEHLIARREYVKTSEAGALLIIPSSIWEVLTADVRWSFCSFHLQICPSSDDLRLIRLRPGRSKRRQA